MWNTFFGICGLGAGIMVVVGLVLWTQYWFLYRDQMSFNQFMDLVLANRFM